MKKKLMWGLVFVASVCSLHASNRDSLSYSGTSEEELSPSVAGDKAALVQELRKLKARMKKSDYRNGDYDRKCEIVRILEAMKEEEAARLVAASVSPKE